MTEQRKQRKGISLTTQILIGLSLGFATGMFFGEKAGSLAIVGKAYIGLIQMSILPYMVVSLISGIGHLPARDTGVTLEFIPWQYDTLFEQLDRAFDFVAGGFFVTSDRLLMASFSNPYMEITAAVVVPDHLRRRFKTWQEIEEDENLRLGVAAKDLSERIKKVMPNTDIVELNSNRDMFENNAKGVTATVISAEAGSAWTILYPAYSVVVPKPHHLVPIALAIPEGEPAFEDYVDDWLRVKKVDGTLDRLYDNWILGKSEDAKQPRWSIGRNVLGLWE